MILNFCFPSIITCSPGTVSSLHYVPVDSSELLCHNKLSTILITSTAFHASLSSLLNQFCICCRPPNMWWCHSHWSQFLNPVSSSITWWCCEQYWTSHQKDRKEFALLSRSSCCLSSSRMSSQLGLLHGILTYQEEPCPFSVVQSWWRRTPKPKNLPKHHNDLNIMFL